MITVISTGLNAPTKARCVESVARQRSVEFEHVYIEAGEQSPPRTALENIYRAIIGLPPDRIVAWVDGDDWLPHDGVLDGVRAVHDNPDIWVSYGSYVCADGRPGISTPYKTDAFRTSPWCASHLKTFRAGLFQRIDLKDLTDKDGWLALAIDQAIMFPMLEMAGLEHSTYVMNIRYIYNYASSYQHNTDTQGLRAERIAEAHIRSRASYRKLVSL